MDKTLPKQIRVHGRVYKLAVTIDLLEAISNMTEDQVRAMDPEMVLKFLDNEFEDMLKILNKADLAGKIIDVFKKIHLAPLFQEADGKIRDVVLQLRGTVMQMAERADSQADARAFKLLAEEHPEMKAMLEEYKQRCVRVASRLEKSQLAREPRTWKSKPHVTYPELLALQPKEGQSPDVDDLELRREAMDLIKFMYRMADKILSVDTKLKAVLGIAATPMPMAASTKTPKYITYKGHPYVKV